MNALFIGRFQPFHNGHLAVLRAYADDVSLFYIGIGSSQYGFTIENPFTFEERKHMIQLVARSNKKIPPLQVVAIPDIHDPPRWVDHVTHLIPDFNVILSNNPFTTSLFTEKGYLVKKTKLFKRHIYSGKEIRRCMMANEPWDHLVPKSIVAYLYDIDAVSRITKLQKQVE